MNMFVDNLTEIFFMGPSFFLGARERQVWRKESRNDFTGSSVNTSSFFFNATYET